ncbi:MAG TPA: hypothetical protein DCS93_02280 [Microscillaceae bacterium]|nr:hypothetical protein [Microscillaceae bacterium]
MKTTTLKLSRIYILALSLIALFTIIAQFYIQFHLKGQSADSRLINISGRQRTLSQKIAKQALLIIISTKSIDFEHHQKTLIDILKLWNQSHQGIQFGDPQLSLPKPTLSQTIKDKFTSIEPYYVQMNTASQKLIQTKFGQNQEEQRVFLSQILASEVKFLEIMNAITFQYDQESRARVENFKRTELFLMMLTLLLVSFEALFIFKPAVKNIQVRSEQIDAQNMALNQAYDEIQVKNHNLISSINYAKTIQKAILILDKDATDFFGKENFFILFKPLDIVSGDFFYFQKVEDEVIFAAVDCVGHGIPGAFMSMIGVEIMNETIKAKKITSPEAILNHMHLKIKQTLNQAETNNQDGMDLALLKVNKAKKEVTFAGAKNPLVYIQDNQLHHIKGNRFSIGGEAVFGEPHFTQHVIPIEQPITCYLFSDGYQDQFGGPHNRKFMSHRFRELLFDNYQKPLENQKEALETTLENWISASNESQIDDILVMGLQIN